VVTARPKTKGVRTPWTLMGWRLWSVLFSLVRYNTRPI